MPISENDVLFNLIGTTYGGDGQVTFALPDLQSRIPMHQGAGFVLAQSGGAESVTLTVSQVPAHSHPLLGSTSTASSTDPAGNVGARLTAAAVFPYGTDAPPQPLSPQAVAPVGGSQPHENMQPYLCVNFIISLFGVFPSQT
jgi:microcystin-dependent protein